MEQRIEMRERQKSYSHQEGEVRGRLGRRKAETTGDIESVEVMTNLKCTSLRESVREIKVGRRN